MEKEDYLESIYNLQTEYGYVRISDVAKTLSVRKPTVTQMMQRLHEEGYVVYEPYLKLQLTESGKRIARRVAERHHVLETFLTILHIPQNVQKKDIHGIEHCLSPVTLERLRQVNNFLAKNNFKAAPLKQARKPKQLHKKSKNSKKKVRNIKPRRKKTGTSKKNT
ncbi:transcriptional regulator [Candidatus Peregrinibacteria bacterium]|nr:transcriptional regulator [Candidatus Peregrinibacteria bacterium]